MSVLRPITQKLTSVPVEELPYITNFLASSIAQCSGILSAPQPGSASVGGDDSVLVHKLKTRISSLLQDRTPQGRWTAVVLVKAVIEAGGWEILKGSEPWARSMISILGKPDPASTKKMAIIALTRIFLLTQEFPTLLREITTPLLPPFVTACLNVLSSTNPQPSKYRVKPTAMEAVILEAFSLLLPHHPATFRPFTSRIRSLLLKVINNQTSSAETKGMARELFTQLHYCAPKNSSTSEWETAFKTLISSVHVAADQVFRAVIEDWESSDEQRRQLSVKHDYEEVVGITEEDSVGLPAWEGVQEGALRIVESINMLSAFLQASSATPVTVPVGLLLDLTSRLCAVLVPKSGKNSTGPRPNPEVGRDERDELFLCLPAIHSATLNLFVTFVGTIQGAGTPILLSVLDQASWIFNAESDRIKLRAITFELVGKLLPLLSSSITKVDMKTLTPIFRSCADTLLPTKQGTSTTNGATAKGRNSATMSSNADNFLKATKSSSFKPPITRSVPSPAAWALAPLIFQHVPSTMMPHSLRVEIDRSIIATNHTEALLASVLNPPATTKGKPAPPSLLPWLAQTDNNDLALEGLLRPRMPLISSTSKELKNAAEDTDEDDEDTFGFKTNLEDAPWDNEKEDLPLSGDSKMTDIAVEISSTTKSTLKNPQKRDFAQVESVTTTTTTSAADDSVKSTSKKPKQDTDIPTRPANSSNDSQPAESSSAEVERKPKSSTMVQPPNIISENVAPIGTITRPQASQDKSKAPTQDEDEDESDFEIPQINMDPDTDDEEMDD